MRISDSRIYGWPSSLRSMRLLTSLALVLLEGCAVHAPSCDGRFEPINVPAPVSTDAQEEGTSSETSPDSDTDHERR